MRKFAIAFVSCLVFAAATPVVDAQNDIEVVPAADPKLYGEYPMAWKEITTAWLQTILLDPTSAAIEWGAAPRAGEYKTKKGDRFVGYLVDFKVNARNQFGAPTGKQLYRVVIRNGAVVWGGHPRY